MIASKTVQQKRVTKDTAQRKEQDKSPAAPNLTGIPDGMKSQYEDISGMSFDDVRVHYNSDKPAQFQALAYTQGNQVYVAPGQETHLGHELGHVVQQKLGIVQPNAYVGGMPLNNDPALERQADNPAQLKRLEVTDPQAQKVAQSMPVVQRADPKDSVKVGTEFTFKPKSGKFDGLTKEVLDQEGDKDAVTRANGYLTQITTNVTNKKDSGFENTESEQIILEDVTASDTEKKWLPPYTAHKYDLEFSVYSEDDLDQLDTIDWWFVADLDPHCIETQTKPSTYTELKRLQPAIQDVIFGSADEAGLTPATGKEGGGGHISLDVETAFGDGGVKSVKKLANFMENYFGNPNDVKFGSDIDDHINAPLISQLGRDSKKKYGTIITNAKSGNISSVKDFKKRIHEEVYNELTSEQVASHIPLADASHYQAVNLDHIDEDESEKRRVEMRRFNAQKDMSTLFRNLDGLFYMLQSSWDTVDGD